MTLRMGSGLSQRIIQVLKDYLPGEVSMVDGEEGGAATPAVPAANYHTWDRPLPTSFPAITVSVNRPRPLGVLPELFGSRIHANYEVTIKVHVLCSGTDGPLQLQEQCYRYSAAVIRVLCIRFTGLETVADPVRNVSMVRWREADFGPTAEQAGGAVARTAMIGVDVEKTEAR